MRDKIPDDFNKYYLCTPIENFEEFEEDLKQLRARLKKRSSDATN